ncbi:MAG: hypothetical protein EHM79_00820, partial [Geobacter sp.]
MKSIIGIKTPPESKGKKQDYCSILDTLPVNIKDFKMLSAVISYPSIFIIFDFTATNMIREQSTFKIGCKGKYLDFNVVINFIVSTLFGKFNDYVNSEYTQILEKQINYTSLYYFKSILDNAIVRFQGVDMEFGSLGISPCSITREMMHGILFSKDRFKIGAAPPDTHILTDFVNNYCNIKIINNDGNLKSIH